eukprot:752987-Hanusia_phi.AAC.2
MEAKDATVNKYGGDEDSIPSIASDLVQISRHLFAFGAVQDEILLEVREGGEARGADPLISSQAATQLVKVKHQATVDELFQAIPSELQERHKITAAKVARNGGLQFVDEEEDEEEDEQVATSKRAPHGRQLELLQRIVKEMQVRDLALTLPAG